MSSKATDYIVGSFFLLYGSFLLFDFPFLHIILLQVIPNMPNAIVQSNEKSSSLYAFLSVEDTSKSADQQKALVGQIQIFNLRNARRVGGLLAEV